MGRGLSPLQKSILSALEAYPREQGDGEGISRLAASTDLIRAVGREPTRDNRSTMSRALARLVKRGLVEAWSAEVKLSGGGHRYCLPGRFRPQDARTFQVSAGPAGSGDN
jgi:hypothetical protein